LALAAAALTVGVTRAAHAVTVLNQGVTPTASRNLSAPGGSMLLPWQLQGDFAGIYSGTPISSSHFLTAQHIGSGSTFTNSFGNFTVDTSYGTGGFVDVPGSDLRIWKINETFTQYAPLYQGSDEAGKHLLVFGRGGAPGAAVTVGSELKGWEMTTSEGFPSWGENDVSNIVSGGASFGSLLRFTFDRNLSLTNEAHLAGGDSGGGLFIQVGSEWKLAGVNLGVDGPYKFQETDPTAFFATLFDKGGLWEQTGTMPAPNPNDPPVPVFDENAETVADLPGASYASRISTNFTFIQSQIPEPSSALLLAGFCATLALRRRRA
jgi:hypothetical protein